MKIGPCCKMQHRLHRPAWKCTGQAQPRPRGRQCCHQKRESSHTARSGQWCEPPPGVLALSILFSALYEMCGQKLPQQLNVRGFGSKILLQTHEEILWVPRAAAECQDPGLYLLPHLAGLEPGGLRPGPGSSILQAFREGKHTGLWKALIYCFFPTSVSLP